MMLPKNENDSPVLENGLHVLEKIKTDPDLMGIKVLVFSSLKDGEIREKADRLGADRYMVKGEYLPTELIAAVKEIIQKL
jgi:DNA-binding NarL/FixJ family response regulator